MKLEQSKTDLADNQLDMRFESVWSTVMGSNCPWRITSSNWCRPAAIYILAENKSKHPKKQLFQSYKEEVDSIDVY